ncbi:hypothetical protein N0V88_004729 [Collariella sp. IMI 366227]|nr:hypothetical protein N0V88_004729 [Collariella sp. IMI 366227]
MEDTRIPVWLDCDPGHDDTFAILLAAYHPALRLLGISTVFGNASLEKTTHNATSILTSISAASTIPVFIGASHALSRPTMHAPTDIHGDSGLDGTLLLPPPPIPVTTTPAIDAAYAALKSCPQEPHGSSPPARSPTRPRCADDVFGITEGPPLHDPLAVAAILAGIGGEHEIPFYDYDPTAEQGTAQRERFEVTVVTEGTYEDARAGARTGQITAKLLPPGVEGVRIPRGLNIPLFWKVLEECVSQADAVNAAAEAEAASTLPN